MAVQLQLVFDETIQLKNEAKVIKSAIRDAMQSDPIFDIIKEYREKATAEMKMLKEKINEEFTKDIDELENIKLALKEKSDVMAMQAITNLMSHETEKNIITDNHGNKYEPTYMVRFKKIVN